jgi:hypothetical protein
MGGGGSFVQPEEDAVRGTMVKRTTNLVTAANNNVISFDTEVYDDDNLWVIGDPTKLGPVPSSYNGKRAVFHSECIWTGNTNNSYRELKIFKNGDTLLPISVAQDAPNSSNTGVQLTSHPYVLATGDYFEICARSGGTETALAAEEYSITFSIEVRMS